MTDLNSFYKTDGVDDVMAEDMNRLISSSDYATFSNIETLTADKDLTDDDCPVQYLKTTTADMNVILPEGATTNHKFVIYNQATSTYNLVVKTFGSVSTLSTLTPGVGIVFFSNTADYFASSISLSKASSSDVATGTDDTKYVTSKAIKDSVNVPNVAPSTSGNVLTSNGSAWASTAPAVTLTNTVTLTNKRVTPRVTAITTNFATPTINTDNCDFVDISGISTAITNMTTNLSGTPTNGQKLTVRLKDDGTGRAITWGTAFASRGGTLPTTTVASKMTTVGFIYNTASSLWGCVAVAQEA